jgi:phosphoribosylglycinamide formyltransferase-1
MKFKFRLALFASGNGTNAERFFEYFKEHDQIKVSLLLSNNPEAFVIKRAEKAGVEPKIFTEIELKNGEVLKWLKAHKITHVVLAGFLWLIPDNLLKSFPNKIINIHPALLPKYGGKGMYGSKVHEAVKAANEKDSGITIHLVNEQYDEGAIVFQTKTPLLRADTPEQIAEKVHKLEYEYYPRVVESWILKK